YQGQADTRSNRIARVVALLCFAAAGALLVMSLVQASSAGAGQDRFGIQLPESRVLIVNKAARSDASASFGVLTAGPATR
ncbi:MAG: hypothetical protein AAFQ35_10465, partial [Pseudomonadota bacterium]